MRTDKGYKFTLQFPAVTMEQQQAGELLEHLGSKKSRVIVDALTDYLRSHPELMEMNGSIQIRQTPVVSKDALREMIREVLSENGGLSQTETSAPVEEIIDNSLDTMLSHLDLFA